MSLRQKIALVLFCLFTVWLILMYWMTIVYYPQAAGTRDDWCNDRPLDFESGCKKLGKERFRQVTKESREKAIQLLQEVSVVELKEEEVESLVGESPPHDADLRPYLVRAVKLDHPASGFMICSRDRALWIYNGLLGWYSPPMVKAPLVIWLPFKPDVVYISCGGAV
jgi:hypothetical protein